MDKILSLLGIMNKANKLMFGDNCLDAMSKLHYLFIASDISSKQKERYSKKCYFYKLEYNDLYTSEELSKAIGKTNVKVIGITDKGFTDSIKSKLKEGEDNG